MPQPSHITVINILTPLIPIFTILYCSSPILPIVTPPNSIYFNRDLFGQFWYFLPLLRSVLGAGPSPCIYDTIYFYPIPIVVSLFQALTCSDNELPLLFQLPTWVPPTIFVRYLPITLIILA